MQEGWTLQPCLTLSGVESCAAGSTVFPSGQHPVAWLAWHALPAARLPDSLSLLASLQGPGTQPATEVAVVWHGSQHTGSAL